MSADLEIADIRFRIERLRNLFIGTGFWEDHDPAHSNLHPEVAATHGDSNPEEIIWRSQRELRSKEQEGLKAMLLAKSKKAKTPSNIVETRNAV